MRHVTVRRLAVRLGVGFLAWAGIFAWIARPGPAGGLQTSPAPIQVTGAELFDRDCAPCHAPDDLRPALRDGGDAARRALEAFLETHGESAGDEDRQIVDYLSGGGLQ